MNRISTAYRFSRHFTAALITGALVLSFVASSVTSHAAVMYSDMSGATVDYTNISEQTNLSTSGKGDGLFGAPTISGDSLDFDPIGFTASSTGGGPSDVLDVQLKFMIQAKDGNVIESLFLTEAGDTTLDNGFSDDDARTIVTANVFGEILEVDGVGINAVNFQGNMTFTPSAGDYQLSVDNPGGSSLNSAWSGSLFLELGPILSAASITGKATKISVSLDNTLTATSAAGSTAFIAKKDTDGVVITTNPDDNMIPEPTTAFLAFAGLLAMAGTRRHS